jgi:hypothetical protein
LGRVIGGDGKWEAARGGVPVKREKGDFGRVRRGVEEALDMAMGGC